LETPKTYKVEEVAEMLRCSRGTAYGMAARGEIPTLTFGRSVRVPAEAFDAWMRQRTKGGK
jgi:excisionase family DNA binding protein